MRKRIIHRNIRAVMCFLAILLSYLSVAQNDSLRYSDKDSYPNGIKIPVNYNISLFNLKVDKQLYNLIIHSKENYENKYKKIPNVIVVDIFKDSIGSVISLENRAFMYINEEDRLFMNESFYGFFEIEETIVLFRENFKNAKNLAKRKKKKNIQIKYGNFLGSCILDYRKERKEYILITDFCAFDLYR